jgi:hypothetical protein
MADMNHISLALCDVSRNGDALTGWMMIGSPAAFGQPPAFRSFPGLSLEQPQPGYETGLRQECAGNVGVDPAVVGAGRPRGRTGVLVRRSPAISAGLAIRFGWRFANGGPRLTAVEHAGLLQTTCSTPAGNTLQRLSVPAGRPDTLAMCLRAGPAKPAQATVMAHATAIPGGRV